MRKVKSAKSAKRRRKAVRAPRRRTPADAVELALATLAHEIRTPLHGILALSELIAAGELPERERQWAKLIKGGAEHLTQLATLVVDGARAGRRGLVLHAEPFRPRALAEAVGATLEARAQAKGLAAEVTIANDWPDLVTGDRVRLRAALENLADNAVKFTENGRVTLMAEARAASRGKHRLIFTVTDSGIGLSPKEVARLFRPFSQANADVARRFGGAGLGLAFVQRLAKAMDGGLKVESRPGRGSTFRLTVTVAAAPESARAGTEGPATQAVTGAKSLRILCAEDNPYARVVLNTILTELGHRLDFAGTGEAAVVAVAGGGLRRGVHGRDAAGTGRPCGDARDPRVARRGGEHSGHRHFGAHRTERGRSRDGGRHERVSAEAGQSRGAGADLGALRSLRLRPPLRPRRRPRCARCPP